MQYILGIILLAVCFFISSWKILSISFMGDQQIDGLYRYWYDKQIVSPVREKITDGEYSYEGNIWYNRSNRADDLRFILSGTGETFPVKLSFKKSQGKLTGKAFISNGEESNGCHFTVSGTELPNGGLRIYEKKTAKCAKHMDWLLKNYTVWRNGDALVGGWSNCPGLEDRCGQAGFVWLNFSAKRSLKEIAVEEQKKIDARVPLSKIVGRDYSGFLWSYSQFADENGKPLLREEGRAYKLTLSFPEILDKEQNKIKVIMKIFSDQYGTGIHHGTAVLTDNRLDIVETERVNGNTNWYLKKYSFEMPDLDKGDARVGWADAEFGYYGGSIAIKSN